MKTFFLIKIEQCAIKADGIIKVYTTYYLLKQKIMQKIISIFHVVKSCLLTKHFRFLVLYHAAVKECTEQGGGLCSMKTTLVK